MIDWKLQARAHACQACSRSFVDKQPYFTLLFDRKHGLERWDVCGNCWEAQYSQGANDRQGFVSFWQGVFAVPPPRPPEPIQKETAETLLRKLINQNEVQHTAACFILAVMLERKRILKIKAQTAVNGARTFVYEHARTGDLFTIIDPDLRLHQLDEVQRQVSHLLEHGLALPENSPPPAPPTLGDEPPVAVQSESVPRAETEAVQPGASGTVVPEANPISQ